MTVVRKIGVWRLTYLQVGLKSCEIANVGGISPIKINGHSLDSVRYYTHDF